MNFKITNIACDACIKLSSMALKKIPGVKNVEINNNGAATVEADMGIGEKEIRKALASVEKTADFN